MKKIKLLFITFILLFANTVNAQMVLEYVITSTNTPISLPLNGTVNVSINWGDGSAIETVTTAGLKNHYYANTGTKSVTITGTLTGFGSNTMPTDNGSLSKVISWDGIGLTSLNNAFYSAYNLTAVPTTLPSSVTNTSAMFYGAVVFNQSIANWNTAAVTDMSYMFYNANLFNQAIGSWNTAAVTNMSYMFYNASAFNQPIGNWNTAAVNNMKGMFYGAQLFNQPIGNWNTAAVINMASMFDGAVVFNQPINTWNTAAVTDMSGMFYNAFKFNQPISSWNTAAVTDMNLMFYGANVFNQDISNWNTAGVTNMYAMFQNAKAFNQPIGNWNTAAVTNMDLMFFSASEFNQNISNWNTAAVKEMIGMFWYAASFNQNIGTWNISAVVSMSNMFTNTALCTNNYDATLNGWSTQTVQSGVGFDGGSSKYSSAGSSARAALITKGWTIVDAGLGTTSGVRCTTTTSTKGTVENNALKIYPNPAKDRLQINFTDPIEEVLKYSIYSNNGSLILENEIQMSGLDLEITLTQMPAGLYIVKINTRDKCIAKAFIKE